MGQDLLGRGDAMDRPVAPDPPDNLAKGAHRVQLDLLDPPERRANADLQVLLPIQNSTEPRHETRSEFSKLLKPFYCV